MEEDIEDSMDLLRISDAEGTEISDSESLSIDIQFMNPATLRNKKLKL
jgi:hypothetical protein